AALQKTRARAIASKYSGETSDPPGTLISGDVVADQRVDAVHDVSDDTIDIVWVTVAHNTVDQVTTISHKVFGVIPFGANAQYLVFLDLDNDPSTGGDPSTLGFPTSFHGAELVSRVLVTRSGEFQDVIGTVWKFQGSGFVDASASSRIVESRLAEGGAAAF